MPLIVVGVLLAATILAALLILMAASAAESAVRLAGIERRRDHLRRVGEATYDVQLAADHYQRAMDSSLERSSGDGVLARRAEEVRDAAYRYQETCRRLVRVLAGGSRPPGSRHLLDLLTDAHHPEAVATARPADGVLDELVYLQDTLDAAAVTRGRPEALWRLRASWHVALRSVRARFRRETA